MADDAPVVTPMNATRLVTEYANEKAHLDAGLDPEDIIWAARKAAGSHLVDTMWRGGTPNTDAVADVMLNAAAKYVDKRTKKKKKEKEMQLEQTALVVQAAAREATAAVVDRVSNAFNDFISNRDCTDMLLSVQGAASPFAALRAVDKDGNLKEHDNIPGERRDRLEHQQIWSVSKAAVAAYGKYKEYLGWPENGTVLWRSVQTGHILGIWTPLQPKERVLCLGYVMNNEAEWRRMKASSENRLGPKPPGDSFQTEFGYSASSQARRDGGCIMAALEYTTSLGVTKLSVLPSLDKDGLDQACSGLSDIEMASSSLVTEHINYIKPASRTPSHKEMMEGLEPLVDRLEPGMALQKGGDPSVAWGFRSTNKVSFTKRDKSESGATIVMKHVDQGNAENDRQQPEGSAILQWYCQEPKPDCEDAGFCLDEHVQDANGNWHCHEHFINQSGLLETYPKNFIHWSKGSAHTTSFSFSLYKDPKTERSAKMMSLLKLSEEHQQQLNDRVHHDPPYRFAGIPGFLTGGKTNYDEFRKEMGVHLQKRIDESEVKLGEREQQRSKGDLQMPMPLPLLATTKQARTQAPEAPDAAPYGMLQPTHHWLQAIPWPSSSSSSDHPLVVGEPISGSPAWASSRRQSASFWEFEGSLPDDWLLRKGPPGDGPYKIMAASNEAGFKNVFKHSSRCENRWTYSWEYDGKRHTPKNGELFNTPWEAAWDLTQEKNCLHKLGHIPAPKEPKK